MPLVGSFTKQPFELSFGPEHLGRQITLYGRWATRTGLCGPWSPPLVMTIAMVRQIPTVHLPGAIHMTEMKPEAKVVH